MSSILQNRVFLSALFAWLIAQCIKVAVGVIQKKKFDFRWLLDTGGMPSSHSSAVSALATSVGMTLGFDSPFFGVTLVFAFIVMFDAQGMRRSVGKQAVILNRIVEDIQIGKKIKEERLKELLGHTPFEVLAGATLGIIIALLL